MPDRDPRGGPAMADEHTIGLLVSTLRGRRLSWHNEDGLQAAIAAALEADGYGVRREVRLDAWSRVDILVGAVAIEVKVAGSAASLERQVRRYAASPLVSAILVVTVRPAHIAIPDAVGEKAVRVLCIAEAGL